MEVFWKGAAAVLLAVVLGLVLDKQERDISSLLSIAVCAMVGLLAAGYLTPVLAFLRQLETLGQVEEGYLGILIRAAGIGLGAELAGGICADAGKASLGKSLQLLGAAAILSLSVPMLQSLLNLVRQLLGGL